MTPITFFIEGTPVGQPRPRARARKFGEKYHAQIYNGHQADGWKKAIVITALAHRPPKPLAVPVQLDMDFYFPRPGRLLRRCDPDGEIRHDGKPDIDNLFKAVADCLQGAGFFVNDSQICDSRIRKSFVGRGGTPGVRVTLVPLAEPETESMGDQTTLFQERRAS